MIFILVLVELLKAAYTHLSTSNYITTGTVQYTRNIVQSTGDILQVISDDDEAGA